MTNRYISPAIALFCLAGPAYAQNAAAPQANEGLDEIIVTAQKREQNLQNVPVSVTAVTGETLVARNVTQFENLTAISPGLTITSGASAPSNSINLRGIGTFAFSIGVEPSVAVVVDDVAILQQAQAFSGLSDIERIEVLRGPQGTLFGKNASAGAINIITKAPTKTLTGRIAATATSDDEYRIEGGISGPLAENVGFRLNGFYGDRKGYVRNLTTGAKLGRDESWGIRGKLQAELSDNFEIALTAEHSLSKTNGNPRTFLSAPAGASVFGTPLAPSLVGVDVGPDNYRLRANNDPYTRSEQTSVQGRATLHLGPVDLISISSHQSWKFLFRNDDVDLTASPAFGVPGGLVQASPFKSNVFSQELRLVSTAPGPFQYLGGLYYSKGDTDRSFTRGPAGPLVARWTANTGTKSYAAFAQATYDIADTTHIDGGIRFNREKIDVSFQRLNAPAVAPANNAVCLTTCSGKAADDHVTGKVALRQDVAEKVMVFASFATGYKGQGYDVSSGFTPARAANPVKPETSKAYELGVKSRFLDNRVQLNISAFWVDYNNFQAQSAVVQPDQSINFQLNNVGKLRTKGVEVELQTKPTRNLSFDFSAAYTDAVVRKFPFANCYTGQTAAQGCFDVDGAGPGTAFAQNLAGKRLANSPKFKFNVSANYDIDMPSLPFTPFISLDYRHQSRVNFDLAQNPLLVQGGYGILNGSVGIKETANNRYRVTLFVNNLLDKTYAGNIGLAAGGSNNLLIQNKLRDSRRYFGIRGSYNF